MQGSRGVNQRKPRPVCWKLRDLNAVTEPTEGAAAFPAAGLGAGDRVRTGDILLGKQTLCQLSYSRPGGEYIALPWHHLNAPLRR